MGGGIEMKDSYYRVYKLENGFKYIFDLDNEIIRKFTNWCFDNYRHIPFYYENIAATDVDGTDIKFIPEL